MVGRPEVSLVDAMTAAVAASEARWSVLLALSGAIRCVRTRESILF
ncbi:MAG: hypothetical protein RLZZ11_1281, partial [Cyanobacteriota bacterium]